MKVHHLVVAATTAALSFGALAGAQQHSQSERSGSVQAPTQAAPQASDDAAVIREAQDQLRAAGYPATPEGLKEFQQAKGIEANGQLDTQTLAALGVGASAASGASDGDAKN